ncbi:hypothetical protein, partial [Catenulispora pinisilvae]|uniref:hypothetical protein n=1 Tax=Catenulispora pinisilvae TaxID=2705253 RepID=UPI001E4B4D82
MTISMDVKNRPSCGRFLTSMRIETRSGVSPQPAPGIFSTTAVDAVPEPRPPTQDARFRDCHAASTWTSGRTRRFAGTEPPVLYFSGRFSVRSP